MTGPPVLYDRIGIGYDATRRADPSIVEALSRGLRLAPGQRVLDAACGTGNYAAALAQRGCAVTGIDISQVMLDALAARGGDVRCVRGGAERLPFRDRCFDAVTCVNAVHHLADIEAAFCEFARILVPGGRLAVFTNTREEVRAFWVARYFPRAVERSAEICHADARFAHLAGNSGLALVERIGWRQHDNPVDLFLYSGKYHPELYLDPAIRAGISTFADRCDAEELAAGLASLRRDIATGAIQAVVDEAARSEKDYSIFVYERRLPSPVRLR
jgi:SAM-dependent methyltransferase